MSEFVELLLNRRVCRDFDDQSLDERVVDQLSGVAFSGPTAGNTDALDVLVLTGQAINKYWDTTLPQDRRSHFPWPGLLNAPLLMIPITNPQAYVHRYSEADKSHTGLGSSEQAWPVPYWWVDVGASVMAQMVAAEALGLGSLFFGQFEHEIAVRETFGIPNPYRCAGTLAVGYPRSGAQSASKSTLRAKRQRSDRIHHNMW